MYAITGITGRVGGTAAKTLQAAGAPIRAIARDPQKAEKFVAQGAQLALADYDDLNALIAVFTDVTGVFLMIPPYFAPAPDFPETRAILATLKQALTIAQPPKIVALSSIGAQHDHGLGLITQSHLLEEMLGELPIPATILRPGWFMENAQWDVTPARETGTIPSFLLPLDRPIPMVSTEDVGRVAAEALLGVGEGAGRRVIELEGPRRYSPEDLARSFSTALGRPVQSVAVPREKWTEVFEAGGMPAGRTAYRAEMVDGFNSGWIEYERGDGEPLHGTVTLDTAIAAMV